MTSKDLKKLNKKIEKKDKKVINICKRFFGRDRDKNTDYAIAFGVYKEAIEKEWNSRIMIEFLDGDDSVKMGILENICNVNSENKEVIIAVILEKVNIKERARIEKIIPKDCDLDIVEYYIVSIEDRDKVNKLLKFNKLSNVVVGIASMYLLITLSLEGKISKALAIVIGFLIVVMTTAIQIKISNIASEFGK